MPAERVVDKDPQWPTGTSEHLQQVLTLENEPALKQITMLRREPKGPHSVFLIVEKQKLQQSWRYVPWRGIDFSVCTKRMSWYPCSAMEEEVSLVALLPSWGSHTSPESHSSEGWSHTDWVQMVPLPVISYGTLGLPFIPSGFHCPCWKMRKRAQCGGTEHTAQRDVGNYYS